MHQSDQDHHACPRPSEPQRRYLARGLAQPGGKLPLFDAEGREVPVRTIQSCIDHGWAEPWIHNPIRPEWMVCKLTVRGYAVLGREPREHAVPPAQKQGEGDE
ncbi:MAG: hypothetical protein JO228_01885 [Xanthobacteraceae bacterium]|nr:hypothetical protein [Xanthobacteraceae bacterium]